MNADDQAIQQTKNWLEGIVIKHNFCPFAAKPFHQNTIRYAVSHVNNERALVDELVSEIALLCDVRAEDQETSLLILTACLADFDDYNQFLNVADAILEEMDLLGVIQIASFHPDYCFADLSPEDVRNYTNRSVYPMFHLIREDSVTIACDTYPDIDLVPEKNEQKLNAMGLDQVLRQIKACL